MTAPPTRPPISHVPVIVSSSPPRRRQHPGVPWRALVSNAATFFQVRSCSFKSVRVRSSPFESVRVRSSPFGLVRVRSGSFKVVQVRSGPTVPAAADVASILKKDSQIDRKAVRLNENVKKPSADARPRPKQQRKRRGDRNQQ